MSTYQYTLVKNITLGKSNEWLRTSWAIAKGTYTGVTPKSSGKFCSKILLVNEIIRLITIKEALRSCSHCNKPIDKNDMALSKDGTIAIHSDCDGDWEEAHGVKFPYECDESDDEPESV
jgi:hypothetical protein